MAKPLPAQADLLELLRYEPETGHLYWRERSPKWFKNGSAATAAKWNTKWAGKRALDSAHAQGYRGGSLFDSRVLAHRVVFKILHGTEPLQIDHENHDRSDNRAKNLTAATYATNSKNQRLRSDSTTGAIGVSRRKNRWFAHIRVDGRTKYLGLFSTLGEAVSARRVAEQQFGFHPNHGA